MSNLKPVRSECQAKRISKPKHAKMLAEAPCNLRGMPIPSNVRMISAKLKPPACTSSRFKMLSYSKSVLVRFSFPNV